MAISVDGEHLTIEKVVKVAREGELVDIPEDNIERVRQCRVIVEEKIKKVKEEVKPKESPVTAIVKEEPKTTEQPKVEAQSSEAASAPSGEKKEEVKVEKKEETKVEEKKTEDNPVEPKQEPKEEKQ